MAVLPLIFSVYPFVQIFALPASASGALLQAQPLILHAGHPGDRPGHGRRLRGGRGATAGHAGTGAHDADPREEFLLGKALAALVPTLVVSYGVFGVFVAAIELFAKPSVASAVLRGPELLAQVLFTPLVAAFSIWVSIAISARSSDPRVAAQLSVLASLPSIVVTTVIATGRNPRDARPRRRASAIALLLADGLGWRIVSLTFDRERLVTGTRS